MARISNFVPVEVSIQDLLSKGWDEPLVEYVLTAMDKGLQRLG